MAFDVDLISHLSRVPGAVAGSRRVPHFVRALHLLPGALDAAAVPRLRQHRVGQLALQAPRLLPYATCPCYLLVLLSALLCAVLLVGAFLLPNEFFDGYVHIARVVSGENLINICRSSGLNLVALQASSCCCRSPC